MAIGRAMFPKPTGRYQLPDDLSVVTEYTDIPADTTYVIVSGERLPPWQKGVHPWTFQTVDEMLAYRQGSHS